ncbi:MAG: GNAT family N-acetyltransferase [Prevotella sp.]|nr:GNAT family N-acetyltransferase [Prevotella sp.]
MEIRKLAFADLQQRIEWMNNPLVYSTMHFDIPVKMDKTIEWYNRNKQRDDRVDFSFYDSKNEIVAFGGITSINKDVRKGETYIFANPNVQHKGIGTEAMIMLCKYGFEILGLNKLYAFTNEDNEASIHLHLKIGFEIEGRLRQEYRDSKGILKDRIYLGYLKEHYK